MIQSFSVHMSTSLFVSPVTENGRIKKSSFFYKGSQKTEPQLPLCMGSMVLPAPDTILVASANFLFQYRVSDQPYLVTPSLVDEMLNSVNTSHSELSFK